MSTNSRRRRSMSSLVSSPNSPSSLGSQEAPSLLQWKFSQVLGEPPLPGGPDGSTLQDDADTVSAIEFDGRGDYLAVGDHGGRVILFQRIDGNHLHSRAELERTDYSAAAPPRYSYMTEFQSHEQEFDCLSSLEIGEKINKLKWCARPNSSLCVLATNDRTIKLWKVSNRKAKKERDQPHLGPPVSSENALLGEKSFFLGEKDLGMANGYHLEWTSKKPRSVSPGHTEDSDQVVDVGDGYSAKCRRIYAHAHDYNINSICNNSDGETFVSADDLRINLWHLEVSSQCFNIIDMKPMEMEDLVEVITSAEFHPSSCNLLAYSSSRGFIRLVDLRRSALCDQNVRILQDHENHQPRTFFTEIVSCISDIKFAKDGRYILSRDYMNLKLWDLHMESSPVATYKVHEYLRPKLSELYNNDYIFDKFDCCISKDGNYFATGSYSNTFKVLSHDACHVNWTTLEASRNPNRISHPATPRSPGLLNSLARGIHRKGHESPRSDNRDEIPCDWTSKITHLAWHPTENFIVCATNSSLYMYYT